MIVELEAFAGGGESDHVQVLQPLAFHGCEATEHISVEITVLHSLLGIRLDHLSVEHLPHA